MKPSIAYRRFRCPLRPHERSKKPRRIRRSTCFSNGAGKRDPAVVFTNASVGYLFSICRRLEGIPLAIELAVARLPFLGLKLLDERLDEHFSLPGAPRNLPPRQQTMQATIAWSVDLLSARERDLFLRVAIFSGGFTLAAAQTVCAFDHLDRASILTHLASLAEKSLIEVVQTADSARYVLLESVRAFALDQLDRSGLRATAARQHATWLAEIADDIPRPMPFAQFTELAPELENARAAVAWALDSPSADDRALGCRIIAGLRELWSMSGRPSELRTLSVASVAHIDEEKHPNVAARVLHNYIVSAFNEPDALRAIERAIPLFDRIGDPQATIALHSSLTFIFAYYGRIADARRSVERVEALSATGLEQLSLPRAAFLSNCAMLHEAQGHFDAARADIAAAEAIAASLGYEHFIIRRLKIRSIFIECGDGNIPRAIEIANEMLASPLGTNLDIALLANQSLACLHLLLGETDAAAAAAKFVLDNTQSNETLVLQDVAAIAALRGRPHVAARLMGFVDALIERSSSRRDMLQQRTWDLLCASLEQQLQADIITLHRSEGARLSAKAAGAEAAATLTLEYSAKLYVRLS